MRTPNSGSSWVCFHPDCGVAWSVVLGGCCGNLLCPKRGTRTPTRSRGSGQSPPRESGTRTRSTGNR